MAVLPKQNGEGDATLQLYTKIWCRLHSLESDTRVIVWSCRSIARPGRLSVLLATQHARGPAPARLTHFDITTATKKSKQRHNFNLLSTSGCAPSPQLTQGACWRTTTPAASAIRLHTVPNQLEQRRGCLFGKIFSKSANKVSTFCITVDFQVQVRSQESPKRARSPVRL